ncbi:MAG TPA: acetyl-CoA C-acyltransferase [Solirubrobacterales bacterium]|jgi:3-oxoadipyl-CoA thiolase
MTDAFVVEALRTPMGSYRGALSTVRPDDLAARTIRAVVERSRVDPERITDVYLGAANQAGEDNRDVARMAALLAALPDSVPGATVNRLCASGLEAVNCAARAVKLGEGDFYLAGGVESMSRAPWVVGKPERGLPRGELTMQDTTLGWRFVNPRMAELGVSTESMGETGENVAERYGVSREDQDAFALRSHQRAVAAAEAGRFAAEIVAVEAPKGRRETVLVEADEGPRPDASLERMAKLPPVFREGGTVTAGNASTLNDGAACLLVASEAGVAELGAEPLARVVATGVAGVDPAYMGIGPALAVPRALAAAGLELDEIDLIELNEAFASQVLACVRELGIDEERLNVNGGAIALGHPLGCSGARLATTLVRELRRRGGRYGIATMCVGVGQGLATVFEAV